jgi:hypothetical protein
MMYQQQMNDLAPAQRMFIAKACCTRIFRLTCSSLFP